MYIRNVHFFDDHARALEDECRIKEMREGLLNGDVYIARQVVPREILIKIRRYLEGLGRQSLPNYKRIERGAPNFHRLDKWDPRAHVGGCFHSFSFFPWNQDVFGLFDLFRPVYRMKNMLSNLPPDCFLGNESEMGCTARLSFHYYPRGCGGLNRHQDPFDYHQITVPIMIMSKKGHDYQEGGAYVEKNENERIVLDDICDYGDVFYFNAQCFHGVERIDPESPVDWLSFEGRWMILFAVNKLADNDALPDSVDLEKACQSYENHPLGSDERSDSVHV